MLIMPVGPITKDPFDFSVRDWPIYAVEKKKYFDCILGAHININDNSKALAQKDLDEIIKNSREVKVVKRNGGLK